MVIEVSHAGSRTRRLLREVPALVLGGVVAAAPAIVHGGSGVSFSTWARRTGVVAAALAFALLLRRPRTRSAAVAGAVALAAVWTLTQARDGALVPLLAAAAGAGAGLVAPTRRRPGRTWTATVAAVAALTTLASATAWTGANSPSAGWFGSLVSHGPRTSRQVALTFDDGPNAGATLAVRDLLDAAGVKGTFFTVGKALDARPDLSRALLEDGHLLGDHSYQHDSLRWLDPRYPELRRTQEAFGRNLGLCPALFRPPHGQHTPFMAWAVHRAGMTMVTWDVSAADWATDDANEVARRVLAHVRPGSIIDLHDGLDGHVEADRSVVVRALPAILDGLRRRSLDPVRLDELVGRRGYLRRC